jgi:hypothetical protein
MLRIGSTRKIESFGPWVKGNCDVNAVIGDQRLRDLLARGGR